GSSQGSIVGCLRRGSGFRENIVGQMMSNLNCYYANQRNLLNVRRGQRTNDGFKYCKCKYILNKTIKYKANIPIIDENEALFEDLYR
ncbi:2749_t:CDS:1, partial [Dentiscutata heterogama]